MIARIFISSVQKELAEERLAIRDFVRGDALLRRFFDVFLFEDLPAPEFRQECGQLIQKLLRPSAAVAPQVTPQVDSGHKLLINSSLQELSGFFAVFGGIKDEGA